MNKSRKNSQPARATGRLDALIRLLGGIAQFEQLERTAHRLTIEVQLGTQAFVVPRAEMRVLMLAALHSLTEATGVELE